MSLYSAQLVVTAREQLNKQLQEKAVSTSHQNLKTEKHNPYHYGETVHQKCKHHGEPKQGLGHKKLLQHIDHTKINSSELEHGQSRRRLEDEKEEISAQMKRWTKIVQKCLKGQHKFTEEQLHAQHTGFYKWLLFIEELYRHYENSLKTQTSIHAIEHQQAKSEKRSEESFELLISPKVEHKTKDTHQVRLPHLPTKQRMQALQSRVAQLQKQLEQSHANDRNTSKQIHELSNKNKLYEQKERVRAEQLSKLQVRLSQILNEVEGFNNKLLLDLKQPQKLKEYPQIIHSQLEKIKEFKKQVNIKDKQHP